MDWIDDLSRAWRREYPGRDVSPLPPLVRLARLGLLLEAFQHEVLEPFDLAPADYGVLAVLRRAGRPYELTPSRLTSNLRRSSGGITKMVTRLEERELVRRTPDPDDGRGCRVRLTRAGIAVQERAFEAFRTASAELLAPLGALRDTDRELARLLDAFEVHFADAPEEEEVA
jgi:DNA-binding MarR family transcriptional regulator